MGDLLRFPARAHVVSNRRGSILRYVPDRAVLSKWKDGAFWAVDVHSASGDSAAMLGRFATEAEADAFMTAWTRAREIEDAMRASAARIGEQMAGAHENPEGVA